MNADSRSRGWLWSVCGLLLLASTINYMDRQTLATVSVRITSQFGLLQEQYGNLESNFGLAFAVGSLFFGFLADRISVRWLYPAAVAAWSVMGFLTGMADSYQELIWCRTGLGFFEGGHWPCAIKTTQILLSPANRSMGNSVLQSGTSIGAILTPLAMKALLTPEVGSWRPAFQWIAGLGLCWIAAWLWLVRREDIAISRSAKKGGSFQAIREVLSSRRMWILIIVVALINLGWQIVRAWMPRFLQQGRGYAESEMLNFNLLFYLATDVGVIGAGALTLWLHRRGATVHGARSKTFLLAALMASVSMLFPWLPKGMWLLGSMLVVGAGVLGVFPIYHALTQEVSKENQGLVTGIGGFAAWMLSPMQKFYGRLIDKTGSFDLGMAAAGLLPLVAWVLIALFWGSSRGPASESEETRSA